MLSSFLSPLLLWSRLTVKSCLSFSSTEPLEVLKGSAVTAFRGDTLHVLSGFLKLWVNLWGGKLSALSTFIIIYYNLPLKALGHCKSKLVTWVEVHKFKRLGHNHSQLIIENTDAISDLWDTEEMTKSLVYVCDLNTYMSNVCWSCSNKSVHSTSESNEVHILIKEF